MDKVSKNAYIWTAIFGDSFIIAACSAWEIVWANLARVMALNLVSGFLMTLGRVLVALMTAGICGFVMEGIYGGELNSAVMPLVIIFLLSFLVASMFMVVVETINDCIFLCFLIDETVNGATDKAYFPMKLKKLVDQHSGASEKQAADKKATYAARQEAIYGKGAAAGGTGQSSSAPGSPTGASGATGGGAAVSATVSVPLVPTTTATAEVKS